MSELERGNLDEEADSRRLLTNSNPSESDPYHVTPRSRNIT